MDNNTTDQITNQKQLETGLSSPQKSKEGPNHHHLPNRQRLNYRYHGQHTIYTKVLEDKETYIPISTNPIEKLDDPVKRTFNDLTKKGQFTKEEQW